MEIDILAFGIAKDIVGGSCLKLNVLDGIDAARLKEILEEKFPPLRQLTSLMVAINSEYATPSDSINEGDEIALIPPVSGG